MASLSFFDRREDEENPAPKSRVFACPSLDRSGNFTGTQTPGTNIYMAGRTIDDRLHTLDIGLPGTIGPSVGVGNLDTEGYALVAKFALSHPLHLLAVYNLAACFRKHLIV